MTFIELCRQQRQEAGYSGQGMPDTVLNQTGELGRVVDWVRRADVKLQRLHPDWTFMRREFEFPVTIGKGEYSLADLDGIEDGPRDVSRWDFDTIEVTDVFGRSSPVGYLHAPTLRRLRLSPGRPQYATRANDGGLILSPVPNVDLVVSGEYHMQAVSMMADEDVSVVPEEFHDLIIWQAMEYYGLHEEHDGSIREARRHLSSGLAEMELRFLPSVQMAGPLA